MSRIYQRSTGRATKWYVHWVDHHGNPHRWSASESKDVANEMARNLRRLVTTVQTGDPLTTQLRTWVGRLAPSKTAKLTAIGLINRDTIDSAAPIANHVEAYEGVLADRGVTRSHQCHTISHIRRIIDNTEAHKLTDLNAERIDRYLALARRNGLSVSTTNHYVVAIQSFARWCVETGRIAVNPLTLLRKLDATAKLRVNRRALTDGECEQLLTATTTGPDRYGLCGYDRHTLYLFALETGLRRGEIEALRVADISFDDRVVSVRAAYAKTSRARQVPLTKELTEILRDRTSYKVSDAAVFRVPLHAGRMLKEDAAAAGVAVVDSVGQIVDFHALRHTCATRLSRHGVPQPQVMAWLGHSQPITAMRYQRPVVNDLRAASDLLPKLSPKLSPILSPKEGTSGA